jgi:hypothetical protein
VHFVAWTFVVKIDSTLVVVGCVSMGVSHIDPVNDDVHIHVHVTGSNVPPFEQPLIKHKLLVVGSVTSEDEVVLCSIFFVVLDSGVDTIACCVLDKILGSRLGTVLDGVATGFSQITPVKELEHRHKHSTDKNVPPFKQPFNTQGCLVFVVVVVVDVVDK